MRGYHCYEQLYDPHPWYEVELLIQLISVWYWKKHGGSIGIYTEEKHLSTLEKYGIEKEYDFIDYRELKRDTGVDPKRFWAISKIQCQLSIPEKEYFIIDTDAYFREMPSLHEEVSFTGMHNENHLTEMGVEVYPPLDKLFPKDLAEEYREFSDVMPVNTCFLHINDRELIEKWIDSAITIAEWRSKLDPIHGEMMTVEQRLLPIIAEKHQKLYSTIVDNLYLPGYENVGNGNEWNPRPDLGGNLAETGKIFFHLWGFKKRLSDPELRGNIMRAIATDLKINFPDKYEHVKKIFPTLLHYLA